VKVEKPGGAPFRMSDKLKETRGPRGQRNLEFVRIPVGKPMAQVLEEAPVGAWIIWTNKDVTARIAAFSARKQAGQTLTDEEQALWDRIDPWENENALKVARDQYAAFPFGVVNEKEIVEGMAKIVFDRDPVPAGYIERNIFISAIRAPKEAPVTA
jgi:hypothetical protein